MQRFARDELALPAPQALDHIILLEDELPLMDLPRLYKGADAFVLPSRGEGWGRPHIEAMSMGLPTIATNWSGNTGKCKNELICCLCSCDVSVIISLIVFLIPL